MRFINKLITPAVKLFSLYLTAIWLLAACGG